MRREGSIRCLVIVPFDEPFETDLPEIRVLRKPVYTLGLYLALNPGTEISLDVVCHAKRKKLTSEIQKNPPAKRITGGFKLY